MTEKLKSEDRRVKAFCRFLKQIKEQQRIITSHEESITPRDESQTDRKRMSAGKPNGLWYSCGAAWLEWCIGEDFGFGSLVHEIELDDSALKIIRNIKEFDAFAFEYGLTQSQWYEKFLGLSNRAAVSSLSKFDDLFKFSGCAAEKFRGCAAEKFRVMPDYVDWEKISRQYSGIEINPYLWRRRLQGGMWYYGWDCASGCVWNESAIKEVKLLARYDEKKGKVVFV